MRQNNCYNLIVTTLLATAWPAAAAPLGSSCSELTNRAAVSQASLPIGMTSDTLLEMVTIMQQAPGFSEAEAMVLYGSRVHHRAGHAPHEDSDLDVRCYFKEFEDPWERLELNEQINQHLAPVGRKAGFQISEEIPSMAAFHDAFSGDTEVFSTHSLQDEVSLWEDTLAQGSRQGLDRSDIKMEFIQKIGGKFPKDVVIIIRRESAAMAFVDELRRRDYTNIVIID